MAETGDRTGEVVKANHAAEEVREYVAVLEKLLTVRDVILAVNNEYIRSAGQADAYRTEPAFKLQGSYRDMNKLAEKVVPVMNEDELQTLIRVALRKRSSDPHHRIRSQPTEAERYARHAHREEAQRWTEIKTIFLQQQKARGYGQNGMAPAIEHMENISGSLRGIAQALQGT